MTSNSDLVTRLMNNTMDSTRDAAVAAALVVAFAHRAQAQQLLERGDPGGAIPFRAMAEGAEQAAEAIRRMFK